MAKQDLKAADKPNQQPEVSRGPKDREDKPARALYPTGMLSPGDFFRMGPISLMRRMNEEMARMFGEMTAGGEQGRAGFAPPIEVMERDGKYVIRAELPGVKPSDISLNITENAVIIAGEHQAEHEEEKGGVHVSERRYGRFYRAVPLPEGARTDDATAHFENGILEIEVPAAERKSPGRQIPIQSGETSNKAA